MQNILDELSWRGLIQDSTDITTLKNHLNSPRTIYVGFDPTSDSLHLGNLLPLISASRFAIFGHKIIIVIGNATALIGDPSGKSSERILLEEENVLNWTKQISYQIENFFIKQNITNFKIVYNYDWLCSIKVIPFLRDIGKYFSVNAMLDKESIKTRLSRQGVGISFTEFSYIILQALDYLTLFEKYDCTVQFGGSDQWGNITAGIDLIRKIKGYEVYGFTIPLLTKSDGTKFGKTEKGAIWLDKNKSSPYSLYQYLLNTSDQDTVKLLKFLTFLGKDRIDELEEAIKKSPEKREAQKTLAREVVRLVHGEEAVLIAEKITQTLFNQEYESLTEDDFNQIIKDAPNVNIHVDNGASVPIVDLLVKTGLASSKSNARDLITAGAIECNKVKVTNFHATISKKDAYHGKFVILTRGGKNKSFVTLL